MGIDSLVLFFYVFIYLLDSFINLSCLVMLLMNVCGGRAVEDTICEILGVEQGTVLHPCRGEQCCTPVTVIYSFEGRCCPPTTRDSVVPIPHEDNVLPLPQGTLEYPFLMITVFHSCHGGRWCTLTMELCVNRSNQVYYYPVFYCMNALCFRLKVDL